MKTLTLLSVASVNFLVGNVLVGTGCLALAAVVAVAGVFRKAGKGRYYTVVSVLNGGAGDVARVYATSAKRAAQLVRQTADVKKVLKVEAE